MRVVLDTNLVVSGLLWGGTPRLVLELARSRKIRLFRTENLLMELSRVLQMKKFESRLAHAGVEARDLVIRYTEMSVCVPRVYIPPTFLDDLEDDEVLACAVSAEANVIISGDHHLLDLGSYNGIPILKADDLLTLIGTRLLKPEIL